MIVWPVSEREVRFGSLKGEMGGGGAHLLKRIPRIKFPQRHAKSSSSGLVPQTEAASTDKEIHHFIMSSSEIPASPANIAEGGKASLQPKRTPVSEREIEAVLLGGIF